MKSKFDCIFVNGDSYSAPTTHQVYADFLSKELGIPVTNIAVVGSNNQRILRSSINQLNDLQAQYSNPLIIIGWSFIRRLEVWYYGKKSNVLSRIPDRTLVDDHLNPRLVTLNVLLSLNEATLEQKSLVNEDLFIHKQLTDFYTNLYMFSQLLDSRGLKYFCFSAAKNFDCPVDDFPWINSLNFVQDVINNPNIYKLHDFCILDWAKTNDPGSHPITGHLSEYGHEQFAKLILNEVDK